jgi:hypothetical protein
MPRRWFAVALAALACSTSGNAAWYKANSRHFVIYANESPKELNDFATRLERFDQAVRYIRGMDDPDVGQGNRLTVFVLPNVGAVQRLMNGDRFIAGFYIPRASGSNAFVPRVERALGQYDNESERIFFHEYSHHLMFQDLDRPLPQWVVEGFAEFMSTVRFERDGSIGLGLPAYHRAYSLLAGRPLPLETMLGASYTKLSPDQRESIYSWGWLLVHYLTFDRSRTGQLDRYAALLNKGVPAAEAAHQAFGDLRQLQKDLNAYLNKAKLSYLKLPGDKFRAGPIEVQPLTEGAAKVIMLRVQSKRGVDEKTAEPLAVQVRAVEARYPGDPLVELTLAEAELDAGHFDAAEAAADRALKANPRETKAMVYKGVAIERGAEKLRGEQRAAAFAQARALFIAANKIDTEDPEPLMQYYRSFVVEGIPPTENAIAALHYASDLAPQDQGLRMNSAMQYLRDRKYSEARRALVPIAYDPHANELAKSARAMIDEIDSGHGEQASRAAAAAANAAPTSQ